MKLLVMVCIIFIVNTAKADGDRNPLLSSIWGVSTQNAFTFWNACQSGNANSLTTENPLYPVIQKLENNPRALKEFNNVLRAMRGSNVGADQADYQALAAATCVGLFLKIQLQDKRIILNDEIIPLVAQLAVRFNEKRPFQETLKILENIPEQSTKNILVSSLLDGLLAYQSETHEMNLGPMLSSLRELATPDYLCQLKLKRLQQR